MKNDSVKNSIWLRLILILALIGVLMIPSGMILGLIHERQARYQSVFTEIAGKWGGSQTIVGPVLSVPYSVEIRHGNNSHKVTTETRYLHLLPESLDIDADIKPHMRYRGIFKAVVYNGELSFQGHFLPPEKDQLGSNAPSLRWEDAFLTLGISDMRGIKKLVELEWDDETIEMNPGVISRDVVLSGISARIGSSIQTQKCQFSIELNLNGSRQILFTPLGKETELEVSSEWTEPSFTGSFLPEEREVSEEGFVARWKLLHLNRSYPQLWYSNFHNVDSSHFGVTLLIPVNDYSKVMRTTKYAVLLISLTFLAFFMIELLKGNSIHPIQYLLTGFALVIFYSLLLSLSEHLGFSAAYLISALATISLITLYLRQILNSLKNTLVVAGILLLIYSYIYFVLQLQDYALLAGSIGLFVILGTIMYLTRNINWSEGMMSGDLTNEGLEPRDE